MFNHRFSRVSRIAGLGFAPNPVTDIEQEIAPPTPAHRTFLSGLGWPFSGPVAAYRTSRLSETYFALREAGILDALDFLFISNGIATATSVANWIEGKPNAVLNGTDMVGGAFITNGTSTFFSYDLAANAEKYTQNNASMFVYLAETPPAPAATTPIIGAPSGSANILFSRNSGSPFVQARINASSSPIYSPTFSAADWGPGLFAVDRPNSATSRIIKNGVELRAASSASVAIPSVVSVGRSVSSYGAQSFTAFGGGRSLTLTEYSDLASILADHTAEMQTLAAL